MPYRDLKLFDVATKIAELVNNLIEESPRGRLLHVSQLRDAVQSVGANISEAFGKEAGPARDYSLNIARGETEEAIRHLLVNFRASRIRPKKYWQIRNLMVAMSKMLTAILRG